MNNLDSSSLYTQSTQSRTQQRTTVTQSKSPHEPVSWFNSNINEQLEPLEIATHQTPTSIHRALLVTSAPTPKQQQLAKVVAATLASLLKHAPNTALSRVFHHHPLLSPHTLIINERLGNIPLQKTLNEYLTVLVEHLSHEKIFSEKPHQVLPDFLAALTITRNLIEQTLLRFDDFIAVANGEKLMVEVKELKIPLEIVILPRQLEWGGALAADFSLGEVRVTTIVPTNKQHLKELLHAALRLGNLLKIEKNVFKSEKNCLSWLYPILKELPMESQSIKPALKFLLGLLVVSIGMSLGIYQLLKEVMGKKAAYQIGDAVSFILICLALVLKGTPLGSRLTHPKLLTAQESLQQKLIAHTMAPTQFNLWLPQAKAFFKLTSTLLANPAALKPILQELLNFGTASLSYRNQLNPANSQLIVIQGNRIALRKALTTLNDDEQIILQLVMSRQTHDNFADLNFRDVENKKTTTILKFKLKATKVNQAQTTLENTYDSVGVVRLPDKIPPAKGNQTKKTQELSSKQAQLKYRFKPGPINYKLNQH